jgi:hypothetical protein
MFKTGLIAGLFVIGATGAMAATVDFENESPINQGPGAPDFENVGTTYINGGITFTSTEFMQLVQTGGQVNGFVPNDNINAASSAVTSFGNIFLTGDFLSNTNMTLSFATALSAISFEIADIDGAGGNSNERFQFEALSAGSVLATTIIQASGGTPDAQVDTISFGGIGTFDQIRIVGTTVSGARDIGWGIDNIVTTQAPGAPSPVPLPAGAVLMLTALGGLGALRARKRRS